MDTKGISESEELILSLPLDCMPPSALVDTLLLAAGVKAVLRTRVKDDADVGKVRRWCDSHGLAGTVDEDRFLVVGRSNDVVEDALFIDRSPFAHEMTFGLLLGYPACCCQVVAEAGEAEIDRLARVAAAWDFRGEFALIDPSGYAAGEALIAHVPCSAECVPSLQMARKALALLAGNPHLIGLPNWQTIQHRMKTARCRL